MGPYYYPTKLLPPRGTPTPVGRVNIDDIIKTFFLNIYFWNIRRRNLKKKDKNKKIPRCVCCVPNHFFTSEFINLFQDVDQTNKRINKKWAEKNDSSTRRMTGCPSDTRKKGDCVCVCVFECWLDSKRQECALIKTAKVVDQNKKGKIVSSSSMDLLNSH